MIVRVGLARTELRALMVSTVSPATAHQGIPETFANSVSC